MDFIILFFLSHLLSLLFIGQEAVIQTIGTESRLFPLVIYFIHNLNL